MSIYSASHVGPGELWQLLCSIKGLFLSSLGDGSSWHRCQGISLGVCGLAPGSGLQSFCTSCCAGDGVHALCFLLEQGV